MEATDPILLSEAFECVSLSSLHEKDRDRLLRFESVVPNGGGLTAYIKDFALEDEIENLMRTYIVADKNTQEIVGYFSLKAGLIALDEPAEDSDPESFYTIPGIELANFAIDGRYRRSHPESKGCGLVIFNDFIVPLVQMAAKVIGVAILYIFALPNERLIENYMDYGFSRLEKAEEDQLHSRIKPRYDKGCIFMFMNI